MFLTGCTSHVPDADLGQRIAVSRPAWESYQEDIKAQVGVAASAEWEGTPIEARRERTRIFVTFRVDAAWEKRTVAMPILLRDPSGAVHQNEVASCEGDRVTYAFQLADPFGETGPAWLELKFPHGEKRLVLSNQNQWHAAQP